MSSTSPHSFLWLGLSLLAGCGIVVDAERFRLDETVASGPGLAPDRLPEGAGGVGGRGVPLWISGVDVEAAVSVEGRGVVLGPPRAAPERSAVAVAAWVAPDGDLSEGETREVTIRVGDDAFVLTIDGLDELELEGTVTSTAVGGRYSEILTVGPVRFSGPEPIRLTAEGQIRILHPLDASARGLEGGPGGFPGGAPGGAGGGRRGGEAGADRADGCAGGGGGGGGRTMGSAAAGGAQGGAAGLPPIPGVLDAGGSGGGGGGQGRGAPSGGRGGGGGGILWLEAPVLELNADLDVSGAAGEGSTNPGCGQESSGGGGGGGGGVVFLRARDQLRGTGAWRVLGGEPGSVGQRSGGEGAPGWIRVDAPQRPPSIEVLRGMAWDLASPIVASEAELTILGTPSGELVMRIDDGPGVNIALDAEGRARVRAPEPAGLHRLCLVLPCEMCSNGDDAQSCIDVGVVPSP